MNETNYHKEAIQASARHARSNRESERDSAMIYALIAIAQELWKLRLIQELRLEIEHGGSIEYSGYGASIQEGS